MPFAFLATPILGGLFTVGQAITIVAASAYSISQQRAAERRLQDQIDASLGQDIRPTNAARPVSVLYGYWSTTGIRVFGSTNSDFSPQAIPTSARGASFGTLAAATGTKNEFAITQDVLCFDGIDSIVNIEIDEQSPDIAALSGFFTINAYYDGGVADPLAFNNSDVLNTATFTDFSYATGVWRLNREDPQFSGLPFVRYYVRGKRLLDPRTNTTAFTNNSILVLLDYLRSTEYGLGLADDQFDFASFNAAATIADEVVQSDVTIGGLINGTTTTRDILRHEFNGELNSGRDHQENIEEIINSIPGAILFYDATGKYKISIPDSTDVVANQSVRTLTERDLLAEATVSYANTRDKLNQVTVNFANSSNDFAADALTYPNRTTTALENTLDAYLAEDQDLPLASTVSIPGISDRYHAANYALALVAESRLKQYMFNITPEHFDLEPGDIIRLDVDQQDLDQYVRIQSARVDRRGNQIEVLATEYDLDVVAGTGTFVWKNENNETITQREDFDFTVPAPVLAVPTVVSGSSAINQIDLVWTDGTGGDAAIVEYIVEVRRTGVANFTEAGRTIFPIMELSHTPVIDGSYEYRVRARTVDGRLSNPSNTRTVQYGTNPIISALPAIRLHENLITDDPGAPTGADGLATGWYDPTGAFGTVPDDPAPHWEARGNGEFIEGRPIIYNFDLDGLGGGVSTTEVASFQDHDFVFSGSIGEETIITDGRPTITDFDFGGQAAEFVPFAGGNPEIWRVDITGTSDATDTARNEEFFIYLDGNSAPTGGTTYNARFFEPRPTSPQTQVPTLNAGSTPTNNSFFTLQQGGSDVGFSTIDPSGSLVTWQYAFREQGSSIGESQDNAWRGFDISNSDNKLLFSPSATNFLEYDSDTQTFGFSSSQTVWEVTPVSVSIVNSGPGTADRLVTVTFNPTDLVTLQTDPDDTPVAVGDRVQWALVEAVEDVGASTVQISIPTESIDETFTLTSGLTTATTLRDDLLTMLQASVTFTDEFTITADVASGLTEVTDGEPIVKLVANDFTDHSIGVTFTDGDGDLTNSAFGSLVEGMDVTESTAIRITYDSNLTPSFQDVVFGGAISATVLSTTLASMIDAHGELSATHVFAFDNIGELTRTSGVVSDGDGEFAFVTDLAVTPTLISGDPPSWGTEGSELIIRHPRFSEDRFTDKYIIIFVDADNYYVGYRSNGLAGPVINSTQLTRLDLYDGITDAEKQLIYDQFGVTEAFRGSAPAVGEAATINSTLGFEDNSAFMTITTDANSNFSEPTIAITTQGTTSDVPTFTVSTTQEGVADVPQDGSPTLYEIIVDGTAVEIGTFASGATATASALVIQGVIDALATHSAVVDGTDDTLISVTSATNGPDVIEVVISQGFNSSTATSTNNLFATRTISQTGVANDIIVGEDSMVTLTVEGALYENHNVSGMSLAEIATLVTARFNAHPGGFFTATASMNESSVVNNAVGVENTPGVTVVPGVLPDDTAATFAVDTVVNDSGVIVTITGGQVASYSIAVGGTEVVTGNFTDSASAITAAGELAIALSGVPEYLGAIDTADPSILTATAAADGTTTPELTIAIMPGLLPDDTAASLSIARTTFQTGIDELTTFINTEWEYFVINQEVRPDGDTTTIGDNNEILVRRGLILDSTTVQGGGTDAVGTNYVLTPNHTTGTRPATLVITGGATLFMHTGSTATTVSAGFILEYSVDGGVTWLEGQPDNSVNVTVSGPTDIFANQLVSPTLGANTTIDVDANIEVMLRVRRTGTSTIGNILSQFLILEELRAV